MKFTTMEKLLRLVARARAAGSSDAHVAAYIGVNRSTLSRWLSGETDPNATTDSVNKISAAYRRGWK
jgi:transcriptional regulator with XRE-family HTH domain